MTGWLTSPRAANPNESKTKAARQKLALKSLLRRSPRMREQVEGRGARWEPVKGCEAEVPAVKCGRARKVWHQKGGCED